MSLNILLIVCTILMATAFSPEANAASANGPVEAPKYMAEESAVDNFDEPNKDPLEKLNRVSHRFNRFVDRLVLRPAAKVYKTATPDIIQIAVSNFFANLNDVSNATNNLLQGKPKAGFSDMGRIIINTTAGVGGLIDPASALGLTKHNEDFGQTLRKWGLPQGPYLVVPFLGPSTITDALSGPVNTALYPVRYLYPIGHRNGLFAADAVIRRSDLLAAEAVVFGEEYLFYREAYLQRRAYLAKDGMVEDAFDDGF